MLGIGWPEFLMIIAVALVVIGPKDLPRALYQAGHWARKAREMTGNMRQGFDRMMHETEMDEMRRQIQELNERPAPPPLRDNP